MNSANYVAATMRQNFILMAGLVWMARFGANVLTDLIRGSVGITAESAAHTPSAAERLRQRNIVPVAAR